MSKHIIRAVMEILCLALLLGTVVFLIVFWKNIPDSVPNHFDGMGRIDSYAPKKTLILLPVMMSILYAVLSLVKTMRFRSLGREVRVPAPLLLFPMMKLAVLAGFAYMTVCSALSRPLGAWYLPVFLTLILGPMLVNAIIVLPRMMK